MKIAWSVVVCLATGWTAAASDERRAVPTYTNEDLARVTEKRGQTGVTSEPAGAPADRTVGGRAQRPAHGEEFWRREAERERRRIEPARRRLSALEQKSEERRRQPGVRPYTDPLVVSYAAQARALRDRIREEEGRFDDRARREGALPGWLR